MSESDRVTRRSVFTILSRFAAIGIFSPEYSFAKAGEPAKVKGVGDFAADFMGCQDERTNGCRDGRTEKSVYELDSAGIIAARSARVTSEWAKLTTQVAAHTVIIEMAVSSIQLVPSTNENSL